jgi:hypothetical protein
MIGRLLARRPFRSAATVAPRLHLESMDERIVPAGPTVSNLGGLISGSNIAVAGHIQDLSPGPYTVTATGGISQTITTSNTDFGLIGSYSGNGHITIQVQDSGGNQSTTYSVDALTSPDGQAPTITLQGTYNGGRSVTLSGSVGGSSSTSQAVFIGGVGSATVYSDSFGNYSATVTASGLGTVYAWTFNGNLLSQIATWEITDTKPIIENFTSTEISKNVYQFTGNIVAQNPLGNVKFTSAIIAINGQQVAVGPGGGFTFTVTLGSQDSGFVYADFTDIWGLAADTVSTYV